MAKRKTRFQDSELPKNSMITVVGYRGDGSVTVEDKMYGQAMVDRRKDNKTTYFFYQVGFCSVVPRGPKVKMVMPIPPPPPKRELGVGMIPPPPPIVKG